MGGYTTHAKLSVVLCFGYIKVVVLFRIQKYRRCSIRGFGVRVTKPSLITI